MLGRQYLDLLIHWQPPRTHILLGSPRCGWDSRCQLCAHSRHRCSSRTARCEDLVDEGRSPQTYYSIKISARYLSTVLTSGEVRVPLVGSSRLAQTKGSPQRPDKILQAHVLDLVPSLEICGKGSKPRCHGCGRLLMFEGEVQGARCSVGVKPPHH